MAGQRKQGTGARRPEAGDMGASSAAVPDRTVPDGIDRRERRAARAGLVLWVGALVVGTLLFHALGDGPLGAPPIDPSGWVVWAEGRDPLVATFAVLRLLVLALSWYLVGATSIGILARLFRAASLVRLADALTVPALRRVLQTALGVSLATAVVASSVPAPASSGRATSAVALPAADDGSVPSAGSTVEVTLAAVGEEERITLEHVGDDGRPLPLSLLDRARERTATADDGNAGERGTGSVAVPGGSDPSPDGAEMPRSDHREGASRATALPPSVVGGEHLVVAGESFWTIADEILAARLDRAPTEAETAAYWARLVEANRDRLVDRDNPDLIFAGQALAVPPAGPNGSTAASGR